MQLGATLIFLSSCVCERVLKKVRVLYEKEKSQCVILSILHTKTHNKTELQYITVIKVQVGV